MTEIDPDLLPAPPVSPADQEVVIAMRFSFFGLSGWQSDFSREKALLFDTARLERRFALLEQVALASLRAQTDQNFHLYILTSVDLPDWAMARLVTLTDTILGPGRTTISGRHPGRARRFLRMFLMARYPGQRVVQAVLDDDDGLAADFIATLRETLVGLDQAGTLAGRTDPYFVSFVYGYGLVFDDAALAEPQVYLHRYPYINLGLSMVSTPGGENLFSIDHKTAPRRFGCTLVRGKPMFVRSIHGLNDSRVAVTSRWTALPDWRGADEIATRFPFLASLQPPPPATARPKRILFSAVRNEGPFLLEWLAYHRAIGFDTFLIASNDSDDGTTELLDALQAAGVVHHIRHSVGPEASPQGQASVLANASGVICDGDWVIWLDADEFLNIHSGNGTLDDLLVAMGAAQGMLIPWRIFGDGGNDRFPGRFLSDAFTGAAARGFGPNATIKTLFRHRAGATRLGERANHRPRLLDRAAYAATDFLNPAGNAIDGDFPINARWLSGIEGNANFNTAPTDFCWDLAQINHYMVRTRDVYQLKKLRGRGFRNVRQGKATNVARHTEDFFAKHNRNEDTDTSILRFQEATETAMTDLLKDPAIARAQENALRLTAERLEQMKSAPEGEEPAPTEGIAETVEPVPAPEAVNLMVPVVTLPDAERAMVEATYATADVILEYGSGGSTLIAAAQGHSLIMSVESDEAWAANLTAVLARDFPDAPVHVHWEDIGPTKAWGRPKRDSGWRGYHRYPLAIWDQPYFRHPDVVLIDGRFRVGCFMATLLRITRPTVVLWDDYTPRPPYARVERYARPVEIVGRMARFDLVPIDLPRADLTEIVSWFNDHD